MDRINQTGIHSLLQIPRPNNSPHQGTRLAPVGAGGLHPMAKTNATKGMHGKADRKARGRTNISGAAGKRSTRPNVPQTLRAEANRPQTPGGTKHRGDRRDTS